ncbi:hypothetical protein R69746_06950 [Paraburkholderia aspalathi]|uniref:phage holin family protein n=1 Tax=Paraburkholderia aspalathi TaxID=1324617 RepID=UPI001909C719|nr:phage holin family protein [Paraburkholderia aspalathi]MBK3842964.1 phage holin family protein [Paraburkholderia aspalathi]CAE6841616.1 hypothetical protein R69746_06950 [Paraburkholderia aspalathi]
MHISFALIALAAHLASVVRVLTYRKNGARHRYHVSWIAWVLVAVMGGSAIELALHAESADFFEAASAVLLALFVFGSRGNIARLLWRSES